MAGTLEGARKARATIRARHGKDFYKRIGAKGGRKSNTGGFAYRVPCNCSYKPAEHLLRECAGYKGGKISKRGAGHETK